MRLWRLYPSSIVEATEACITVAGDLSGEDLHDVDIHVYVGKRQRLRLWLQYQLRWAWRRFWGRPLMYAVIDGKAA